MTDKRRAERRYDDGPAEGADGMIMGDDDDDNGSGSSGGRMTTAQGGSDGDETRKWMMKGVDDERETETEKKVEEVDTVGVENSER